MFIVLDYSDVFWGARSWFISSREASSFISFEAFFVVAFKPSTFFFNLFFQYVFVCCCFFSPLRSFFDNQTHIRNFIRLVNELRTCSVSYVKKFTVLGFLAAEFQLLPCVEILASSVLRVAWCDTS